MEFKWKYIPYIIRSKMDIAKSLTADDFEGAPIAEEPDGDFQMIDLYGTTFYRDIETGEVSY